MEAWRRNTYSSQTHHIIHGFSCSEEDKLSLSQTVENHQHKANIFWGNFVMFFFIHIPVERQYISPTFSAELMILTVIIKL